jgi:hypothetical protein
MMQQGLSRRPSPVPQGPGDPMETDRGIRVRKSATLSAADKWAWRYLEIKSRAGRERVPVTAGELASDEGRSGRAGSQRLANLAQAQLIRIVDHDRARGVYVVEVCDPRNVLAAVARAVDGDGQLELFGDTGGEALSESLATAIAGDALSSPPGIFVGPRSEEPAKEPSEDPSQVPPSASGLSGLLGPSVLASAIYRPLTIGSQSGPSLEVPNSKDQARGGTFAGSSAGTSDEAADFAAEVARRQVQVGARPADVLDVTRVAALAASVARRVPSEREQAAARERWITTIREKVADPQLKTCVMVKVACAIVSGELPARNVEEIFGELRDHRRAGTLRGPAGIYFLRAAQAQFRRHGLEWTGYASRNKPKPK